MNEESAFWTVVKPVQSIECFIAESAVLIKFVINFWKRKTEEKRVFIVKGKGERSRSISTSLVNPKLTFGAFIRHVSDTLLYFASMTIK